MLSLNPIKTFNGELLYNFLEFYRQLDNYDDKYIGIYDCILTPYYVYNQKRFELYEFELNIRLVEEYNFEKHLLQKTGRTKLVDVPQEVYKLHEYCYIELLKTKNKISKKKIQKYIEFLFNNEKLKFQIQKAFNRFKLEELFFEFY